MRVISKPDVLESQLVLGVVKQVKLSEGMSHLIIEDQDSDLHEVKVHSKLLQPANVREIEGTKVICGTRRGQTFDGPGPSFFDTFEVLHLLDGSKAGETLTHRYSS